MKGEARLVKKGQATHLRRPDSLPAGRIYLAGAEVETIYIVKCVPT
jgi:monoamine oxidase